MSVPCGFWLSWFQSTLAITGERNDVKLGFVGGKVCFNPRSPLLASETISVPANRRRIYVSIHARHYWRAKPSWRDASESHQSFQSTLAITGERNRLASRVLRVHQLFQSTLAITGERNTVWSSRAATLDGFNPRSPLLASETAASLVSLTHERVSIHARHYWRAKQLTPLLESGTTLVFQSTLAITGERNP